MSDIATTVTVFHTLASITMLGYIVFSVVQMMRNNRR